MNNSYNDNNWPGKFEGAENQKIAEYLNTLAMDGWAEREFGSVIEPPFYWQALLLLDKPNSEAFLGEPLQWAYIIKEDSDGFFTYVGYDDIEKCLQQYLDDEIEYGREP